MRIRSKSTPSSRLRALARGAAWPLSLMLVVPTGACAATPKSDFELIRYKLPETAVSAKISLTLESCGADPEVSAELSVAGEAVASAEPFSLTTGQLTGAIVKRELKVSLHDTGAIAILGSSNENRLGAIVGDAIKFVAQVVGAAAGLKAHSIGGGPTQTTSAPVCSPEAQAALDRVAVINKQLKAWRATVPADPVAASAQSKAIDRLDAERARLRVGILHADLSGRLKLADLKEAMAADPAAGRTYVTTSTLEADRQDLPWLNKDSAPWVFDIAWTVTPPRGMSAPAAGQSPVEVCKQKLAPTGKDKKGALGVCLPRPMNVAVEAAVSLPKSASGGGEALATASKTLPMPQWGVVEFLDLKGGDRDVNLTIDKFGRTTEASWTAKARAETVAAGLAGAAEQVAAFTAANSTIVRQKSEIDALTTQQTLNRLRACREVLAAGGSACPAEATVDDQPTSGGN